MFGSDLLPLAASSANKSKKKKAAEEQSWTKGAQRVQRYQTRGVEVQSAPSSASYLIPFPHLPQPQFKDRLEFQAGADRRTAHS